MMKVLVTGGAGYIGSHVCLGLLKVSVRWERLLGDVLCIVVLKSVYA